MADNRYKLHGLKLSYFTGKLEAYFQVKGVPFDFVPMDRADFRRCAEATGIAQMPQVQAPNGTWLTDTTAIITHFEKTFEGPALSPETPIAKFFSLLLEDLFDEWLWRPALYYRWAFKDDMRLMSSQAAKTMLRDVKAPLRLRQHFIKVRQKRVYLAADGVTRETAPAIEQLYLDTLAALEPVFSQQPFLMGERPCEADFGLFGPFFRHFSHDPTPAGIMRERAPKTFLWTARLWATRPSDLENKAAITDVDSTLDPLIAMAGNDYLPYLQANAAAYANSEKQVQYRQGGVEWSVPTSPYRVYCLNQLKTAYTELKTEARKTISRRIGTSGEAILMGERIPLFQNAPTTAGKPTDRLWKNSVIPIDH
ncbi:glutathione S-transferase family protein [Hyphomonas sp. FCG-A18]|uniref:glutathione S-transferase family protein n=1 Tax=Hyphomonas sp. FCG-A18 TaxID=3080019 RepID=UPI002B2ED32F|nr:glutathione S-transferase family protein [Hyphomonas sp. FCG-A18]